MKWGLTLLGDVRATTPEGSIDRLRTRTTFSLLAYLIVDRKRSHSREELVSRFWPEDDEETGRQKLRLALFSIKKSIGDVLISDRVNVGISPNCTITCDRLELSNQLRLAKTSDAPRSHLLEADRLYAGPFMPGFYDEWILQERDHLERDIAECWLDLAHLSKDQTEALKYAEKVVAVDPYSERAHLLILESMKQSGRFDAVRSHISWIEEIYAEIDLAPSAALKAFRIEKPEKEVEVAGLVGRESELAQASARVSTGGIITLWGPAGIGKTRLAQELSKLNRRCLRIAWVVAEDSSAAFDLTAALQAALGPAPAMVIQERGLSRPTDLELLIVDNFEGHVDASSNLLSLIAAANPNLSILVTSQRRLGIEGEHVIEVRPLGVPGESASLANVAGSESVRMLRKRLRDRGRDFLVNEGNAGDIGALCRRMDGNALALELVAEWLEVMGPRDVLERLDRSALKIKSRTSGRKASHSSLDAAIETSISILPAEVCAFAEKLSVFVGGFCLDTVEEIYAELDVVSLLAELESRALINLDHSGNRTRYNLFDSVRRVLSARLTEEQKNKELERHVDYWNAVAIRVAAPNTTILEVQLEDTTNLVQSIEHALVHRDPAFAARMVLGLAGFWPMTARWSLFESQLRRALKRLPPEPSELLADVYNRIGVVAFFSCRYDVAEWGYRHRMRICEELGNELGIARSKGNIGAMYTQMGRLEEALPLTRYLYEFVVNSGAEPSLPLYRVAEHNHSECLLFAMQDEEGFRLLFQNLETNAKCGDRPLVALCCSSLARQFRYRGRFVEALSYTERSLAIFREIRELHRIHTNLIDLAMNNVELGNIEAARKAVKELATMVATSESIERCGESAEAGAWLAHADGDAVLACQLLAAGAAWVNNLGVVRCPIEQAPLDNMRSKLAEILGDRLVLEETVGRTLSVYEVADHLRRLGNL